MSFDNGFEIVGNAIANGSMFFVGNKQTLGRIHQWDNVSERKRQNDDGRENDLLHD